MTMSCNEPTENPKKVDKWVAQEVKFNFKAKDLAQHSQIQIPSMHADFYTFFH